MKFSEYTYLRPDIELFGADMTALIASFTSSRTANEQLEFISKINRVRNAFLTMYNICYIRHSVDTKDDFYESENRFFDESLPIYEQFNSRFYQALLAVPNRDELESALGMQLFVLAEMSQKTFAPEIIPNLIKENTLSSEYMKIKAGANLEVEGNTYNLSSIAALEVDANRHLRQKAVTAKWTFYQENASKIEQLFDDLVAVRTDIAHQLGMKNYTELGYYRMMRSDYNQEMVAQFRQAVQKYIVPVATALQERKRKRLGLDTLSYYDTGFHFPSGNPNPKGDPDWIIQKTATMYKELSSETNEFFNMMQERELMDVVAKDGKTTGGYCTYIPNYGSPFIFSNFNGTSSDIVVMTHEAGHAFQVYSSRNIDVSEYAWPTYEAAEIHSMSMEYFTFPWMRLFFEEDTEKYLFSHISSSLTFIPYGVAVDEFQHLVYNQPDMTSAERNAAWKKLEAKYLPHLDHTGMPFLEAGGMWQRQNHIFRSPFYYIDYALAQICAFQFWQKDTKDHDKAWAAYLRLCQAGGSQSFLDLVQLAGLNSPFQDEVIREVTDHVAKALDHIDDQSF